MNMKRHEINLIVWQEGDQYVSQCLDVDVASCGDTATAAIANLQEALNLYFEDHNLDNQTVITNISLHKTEVTYA